MVITFRLHFLIDPLTSLSKLSLPEEINQRSRVSPWWGLISHSGPLTHPSLLSVLHYKATN